MDDKNLPKAQTYYDKQINWMINDLVKSNGVDANYLVALGCIVYTEIIGRFLPKLDHERGLSQNKRARFYRCLYRLKSSNELMQFNDWLKKETGSKEIYDLRNSMAHRYSPSVSKKENNGQVTLFLPSLVAKHGISKDPVTKEKGRTAPIFFDFEKGRIVVAVGNYIDELKEATSEFYELTFKQDVEEYKYSAIEGIKYLEQDQ
ncbi:hypothetical protein GF362_00330 [Candidatus Dojkabacteria bacterium]|nr:hypothetical protein [Candidatus Dojkabacteria bacterium]